MADIIEYKSEIIMDTLKHEIVGQLGAKAWDNLTDEIGVPDIKNESKCACKTMREFMERFDAVTDTQTTKSILTHVRHGLKHSQFDWAKKKFEECGNNIDAFMKRNYLEDIENFKKLRDTGGDFYGQPITPKVYDFMISTGLVSENSRVGSEIHITSFPYEMAKYIAETDTRKKRYYACHCSFARESILSDAGEVSKTLCYCSLGHAKVMWEAIFDTELDGEVIESALAGDMMCKYVIYLPNEIMQKYS